MSGAQGALPKDTFTPTEYESVPDEKNRPRTHIRSREDEPGIPVQKVQDKVKDPVGVATMVFANEPAVKPDPGGPGGSKPDFGVTGTG